MNLLGEACLLGILVCCTLDHCIGQSIPGTVIKVWDPLNKWTPEEEDEIERFKGQWHQQSEDEEEEDEDESSEEGRPLNPLLTNNQILWLENLGEDSDGETIPQIEAGSDQDVIDNNPSIADHAGRDSRRRWWRRWRAYRKEVRQMSARELGRYTRAVNLMKRSFPDRGDPRSEYDIFVQMHQEAVSPAAHNGAAFLPWHREYLRRFEQALRRHVPGASIPYWDSTLDQRLPQPRDSVLWTEELLGNSHGDVTQGPFAHFPAPPECQNIGSTLTRRWSDCPNYKTFLFSQEDLDYIMRRSSFRDIAPNIDTKFEDDHGAVHVCIGGHMGTIQCSPFDPIFYMHHAFIDCQWEEFRQNHQTTDLATDYPTEAHGDIGGPAHVQHAPMAPFPYYLNIHGLSRAYTNYYYSCAPRPKQCKRNSDCRSRYLWCDTRNRMCVSKVKVGGDCTGLPNVACYGTGINCNNNICTEESRRGK